MPQKTALKVDISLNQCIRLSCVCHLAGRPRSDRVCNPVTYPTEGVCLPPE